MLAGFALQAAAADVEVQDAWARETLPAQNVGGVYMKLKSKAPAWLVDVESPIAKRAEIHEMRHEGDVMKMRRVDKVELPAGREVTFSPGGLHVMLMDLQQALKPGQNVRLTLTVERGGQRSKIPVMAPVKSLAQSETGDHRQK